MDNPRSANDARPIVEYHRLLKPLLPERAFAPSPGKLIPLATHLVIVVSGYAGIRFSNHWLIWFLCSLVIGHSLACIALFAHELSHNTVIRNRGIRYFLESLAWGLNFFPPTVWRRIHNQSHHVHANMVNDPDRWFLASEANLVTGCYIRTFFPNKRSPFWNPLVWLYFMPYILRNTVAAFYPGAAKPAIVPSKPRYNALQRIAIALEIAAIMMLQVVIYHFVGGVWLRYLFASPIAGMAASCVVLPYAFTNHFLNPLGEINDPLAGSTSVIVPRWCNFLHFNVSYHTEHHLFPGMNSDFYPDVSRLVQEHFGDRYHRIRISQAWKRLWRNEVFVAMETSAKGRDLTTSRPTAR